MKDLCQYAKTDLANDFKKALDERQFYGKRLEKYQQLKKELLDNTAFATSDFAKQLGLSAQTMVAICNLVSNTIGIMSAAGAVKITATFTQQVVLKMLEGGNFIHDVITEGVIYATSKAALNNGSSFVGTELAKQAVGSVAVQVKKMWDLQEDIQKGIDFANKHDNLRKTVNEIVTGLDDSIAQYQQALQQNDDVIAILQAGIIEYDSVCKKQEASKTPIQKNTQFQVNQNSNNLNQNNNIMPTPQNATNFVVQRELLENLRSNLVQLNENLRQISQLYERQLDSARAEGLMLQWYATLKDPHCAGTQQMINSLVAKIEGEDIRQIITYIAECERLGGA